VSRSMRVRAELATDSGFAPGYDAVMGRWSRLMAARFLRWLSAPPQQRWLDVGCGTGALTEAILQHAAPSMVCGVDPQAEFVSRARAVLTDSRCRFIVGEAEFLPKELESFDVTVSALMLNLLANPADGLAEMIRVTRPGGRIASYLWDFARGMQLARYFWDAAIEFDPVAATLDQGRCYPLCHPDRLRELFVGSELVAVDLQPLQVPTVFRNFDDYWVPLESGYGRATDYIASLVPEHRDRLRERLRQVLPTRTDDSIALTARAWAIVGRRQ